MTKTPISLQELRRKIYTKAKSEPSWRFTAEASAGKGGVSAGCMNTSGCSMRIESVGRHPRRKRSQFDRSHKP